MNDFDLYVRVLTELDYVAYGNRSTSSTRLSLQDVLCELRDRASKACQASGEHTQDTAEYAARKKAEAGSVKNRVICHDKL